MATAVLLDVFRAKGINNAYALTVKPRILNPEFTKRLSDEPFPQTPDLLAIWKDEGCFMVAIGNNTDSKSQWNAHLVTVIPKALKGRDAICDLTITQANVPDWGIELAPVMVGASDLFTQGKEALAVTINSCRIIYMAFPEDRSFEQTLLWKPNDKREYIVKRVLAKL
jgi:hypothetical protein